MIEDEHSARAYVETLSDVGALTKLERFGAMLAAENDRQNLIAKATLPHLWRRHIADSAQLLAHVPRETGDSPGPWIDLGTGAGFPGLIVAILRPEWDIRAIESRRMRVEWLNRVRSELGLANFSVTGSRVEMVENIPARIISARAFAPMPRLIDLSARFSTERTLWLLPKGRSAAQDLNLLPESIRKLFHVEQSLTDSEAGIVVGRLAKHHRAKGSAN